MHGSTMALANPSLPLFNATLHFPIDIDAFYIDKFDESWTSDITYESLDPGAGFLDSRRLLQLPHLLPGDWYVALPCCCAISLTVIFFFFFIIFCPP